MSNPNWWGEAEARRWEQARSGLRQDWERAKVSDVSLINRAIEGEEIQQRSVRANELARHQAMGSTATDPLKTEGSTWEEIEESARYGYGAGLHYAEEWNPSLEPKLREEWTKTYRDRPWETVRDTIRFGWDRARTK